MDPGKRTKEATAGSIAEPLHIKIGGEFKVTPNPPYHAERIKVFEQIYNEQKKQFESQEKRKIEITLKDGKPIEGKSFETTPLDLLKKLPKKVAEQIISCKVTYTNKDKGPFDAGVIDAEAENGDTKHTEKNKPVLWDLAKPLEGDCKVEFLSFEDPEGKTVFWHSSAHIMGGALEVDYGCHLCIGPPLDNGFYYDAYLGNVRIDPAQWPKIEEAFHKFAKDKHAFQKVYLTKKQALEMFKHNPFKVHLITSKIPDDAITTAYRCGNLVDLCTGPHIPTTDLARAFKVTKASQAYWLGKQGNDELQRVYGITFPSDKLLKEYEELMKEIAKRDHRNIGKQQELFLFNPLSPGSAFFHPHGAVIYNKLIDLMKREYKFRGYTEVMSPNMYNSFLWQISGHWQKYKDNMFVINVENQDFGLKPMNCPGHCLMFDSILRSYKELPLRFADFGVLHRNEVSGALTGLTRVRRFQQDDAHLFCAPDQIMDEVMKTLQFINYIYDIFGFEFKLELSTMPENHLGEVEMWRKAEAQLTEALNKFGRPWKINEGDGAFYGPKIDIKLYDALKREHQCGTVQLDFQLPIRFNLQFRVAEEEEKETEKEEKPEGEVEAKPEKKEKHKKEKHADKEVKPEGAVEGEVKAEVKGEHKGEHKGEKKDKKKKEPKEASKDKEEVKEEAHAEVEPVKAEQKLLEEIGKQPLKQGFARPVMIHRAILGSVERMLAILCEHTGGKWPFWLSPRQVIICPVSEKFLDYAERVYYRLQLEGYTVEIDRTNVTLNKKIRNAQIAQFNYIAVVGEQERANGTVNLRDRDQKDSLGIFSIQAVLKMFATLQPQTSSAYEDLKKKAFFEKAEGVIETKEESKEEKEFQELDNELRLKTVLEGEGYDLGKRDHEIYEKLKEAKFEESKYPNLNRWRKFVQHSVSKK
jgi:threonyl-tRNA synthetase